VTEVQHPPLRSLHPDRQIHPGSDGNSRRPAASNQFQTRGGWTQLPTPQRALRKTTPRWASWSRGRPATWLLDLTFFFNYSERMRQSELETAGLCWYLDSSPVAMSVLWEDKVEHMTPLLGSPPHTPTHPHPGLFLGVWLEAAAPLPTTPLWGLSVCSSRGVWREGSVAEITGGNWTPGRLHGNVREGWHWKDRKRGEYISHNMRHNAAWPTRMTRTLIS